MRNVMKSFMLICLIGTVGVASAAYLDLPQQILPVGSTQSGATYPAANMWNGAGMSEPNDANGVPTPMHGNDAGDAWISEQGSDPNDPNSSIKEHWVTIDLGALYTLAEIQIFNFASPGGGIARGIRSTRISISNNNTDWTVAVPIVDVPHPVMDTEDPNDPNSPIVYIPYPYSVSVDMGGNQARFVKFDDFTGVYPYKDIAIAEIMFFSAEVAENPTPANKAVDVDVDSDLAWEVSNSEYHQELYFGTDRDNLASVGSYGPGTTTHALGTLDQGETYYWRVDEVEYDGGSPVAEFPGMEWSFVTYVPCTAQIAGDTNHDCVVDIDDLANVAYDWLKCNRIPATMCP